MLITSVAVKHIIFWNTALLHHWTGIFNNKENILTHIYDVLEGKHLDNGTETWHSQGYALQKKNLIWFSVSLNSKRTET